MIKSMIVYINLWYVQNTNNKILTFWPTNTSDDKGVLSPKFRDVKCSHCS